MLMSHDAGPVAVGLRNAGPLMLMSHDAGPSAVGLRQAGQLMLMMLAPLLLFRKTQGR